MRYIILPYVLDIKGIKLTGVVGGKHRADHEPSEKDKEIDISEFTSFLESKSIPRLSFFLYDLYRDLDPMVRVKSGANIRVQELKITRWWFQAKTAVSNNKGKETL
ncbi:11933_t:CDS:2 [Funneliformis caledonium]|uniref:11933_t:CDS:1 n=1 Tax=Funneliformis caledonium TaxID=1117310 RepID=A0A9N9EYL1_9GLOM|nr:11933_t:CDS:2 [Funneliformis caledonium]